MQNLALFKFFSDEISEVSEASCSEEEGAGGAKSGASGEEDSGTNRKVRRNRTSFSSEQLEVLETAFKANTYPDQDERERIAAKTKLNEDKIMVFFE